MTISDSIYQARPYFSKAGLMGQLVGTIKGLLLRPGQFFLDIKHGKINSSALVFLILFCFIYVIGGGLFIKEERWLLMLVLFLNAFLTPFILAFVIYLVSIVFCRRSFTYGSIFMITAYSSVTLLVSWIPGVSWLTGIWRFYLIGLGMTRTGNISGRRATVILAVAAAIIVFLFQLLRPILMY